MVSDSCPARSLSDSALIAAQAHTRRLYLVQRGNRDKRYCRVDGFRCHGLSLPMNRVCSGQSSDSERASAEWQSACVTPQSNVTVSFSLVSRVSIHLIEFIAIEI